MKVLHVIDSGGLYGAEIMLLNLMEEQAKSGVEPILASIGDRGVGDKPVEIEARKLGLQVRPFRMRPGPNPIGAYEVLRFAWNEGVDLLHSHGYKGNILFGFLPRKYRRMPIISTIHGWTWTGGMTRMMIYEWLDGLSLAHLDRIVLVSESMKHNPRIRNRRGLPVAVVPNGIPVSQTSAGKAEENGLRPEIVRFCRHKFTIGAVGRLSKEKGFDLLLDSIAVLLANGKDIHLVLLGEGGERSRLEKKIIDLGLRERVLMPGYVERARSYLPLCQLFVMPSVTEGLPIVLLEAMQAEVPIISCAVGGIPEVLAEGEAGLLVKAGSREALANGINEVMSNPASAKQRTFAALKRAVSLYSREAMAASYLEIYQRVLQ